MGKKLRGPYAMIGEKVERRIFGGCMADVLRDIQRGVVQELGQGVLRHYPDDELAYFILWDNGMTTWHPAAAYIRCEDGVLRWDS